MGDKSGISWCDATNNAQRGCSHAGRRGCDTCYAESQAANPYFGAPGKPYDGLTRNGRWTGEVRFVPKALVTALGWRKPRIIFWDSMSDIWHPKVPAWQQAAQLGVAAATPQHVHCFLTKRPGRAAKWHEDMNNRFAGRYTVPAMLEWAAIHDPESPAYDALLRAANQSAGKSLPQRNILLGTTVSGPEDLDQLERLFDSPSFGYFASFEPLLEPIGVPPALLRKLSLAIIGCESGALRRPCPLSAVVSLVKQCQAVGVAVHVKQIDICGRVISDPADFPDYLRLREMPRRSA